MSNTHSRTASFRDGVCLLKQPSVVEVNKDTALAVCGTHNVIETDVAMEDSSFDEVLMTYELVSNWLIK